MNGKKFVREIYYLEMTIQSFVSLAFPIGAGVLLGYFLTEKKGAATWVYVPLILAGTAIGLFSMVRFLSDAGRQVAALEKQHQAAARKNNEDPGKTDRP